MKSISAGAGKTSFWFWLVPPLLALAVQIVAEILIPEQYKPALNSEGSPIEDIEFLVLLPCIILSALLLFKVKGPYMKLWVGIAMVACIYIAGEEESWGQHIFGWNTPEFWTQVNDQQETNLHNTSSWLDQKPRALIFAGIVVGGLIIPALRRWKAEWLPARFESIYPKDTTILTALLVLLLYVVDHVWHHFMGYHLFWRVSEVQEFYIYYFIFLYLLELRKFQIPQE